GAVGGAAGQRGLGRSGRPVPAAGIAGAQAGGDAGDGRRPGSMLGFVHWSRRTVRLWTRARRWCSKASKIKTVFTGIVTAVGKIARVSPTPGGVRAVVEASGFGLDDVAIGDSIAVNGACLTVAARTGSRFELDLS